MAEVEEARKAVKSVNFGLIARQMNRQNSKKVVEPSDEDTRPKSAEAKTSDLLRN
jgi:hypothetical protein